jgi:hypothetical protein
MKKTILATLLLSMAYHVSNVHALETCEHIKNMSGTYTHVEINNSTGEETFLGNWTFKRDNDPGAGPHSYYLTKSNFLLDRVINRSSYVIAGVPSVFDTTGSLTKDGCLLHDEAQPGYRWRTVEKGNGVLELQDSLMQTPKYTHRLTKLIEQSNECANIKDMIIGEHQFLAISQNIIYQTRQKLDAGKIKFSTLGLDEVKAEINLVDDLFSRSYSLKPVNKNGTCHLVNTKTDELVFLLYNIPNTSVVQLGLYQELIKELNLSETYFYFNTQN